MLRLNGPLSRTLYGGMVQPPRMSGGSAKSFVTAAATYYRNNVSRLSLHRATKRVHTPAASTKGIRVLMLGLRPIAIKPFAEAPVSLAVDRTTNNEPARG